MNYHGTNDSNLGFAWGPLTGIATQYFDSQTAKYNARAAGSMAQQATREAQATERRERNKTLLIVGGIAVAAGVAFLLTKKRRGRRR